ncbi:MAG TPA: hypothetical protein VFD58_08885 [Blastocatellia bacterium]|nr:hypothetical protein [Blastocatellia bacterium]
MEQLFHTSQAGQICLGRRIGGGGEGKVYEIHGSDDLVAKIYHEPPPVEKAEKLVALARLGTERLFRLSAWPVDVLRDKPGGQVTGFVMKKIGGAEEVHTLHSPRSRLQKFPEASWAFLIYVAANIARAVSVIHEYGFVIGDINPKNILVTRKATVCLLDCDSFQVSVGGRKFRCEGGFPEYTPPELQGLAFREVDRTQAHDCFGLAVVVFQLLFMGRHPFSGRYCGAGEMPLERAISESRFAWGADAASRQMQPPPGALALDAVPDSISGLFRRAFLSTDRPEPRAWIEPLEVLAKALKKCDLHSGHHYYQALAARGARSKRAPASVCSISPSRSRGRTTGTSGSMKSGRRLKASRFPLHPCFRKTTRSPISDLLKRPPRWRGKGATAFSSRSFFQLRLAS